MPFVTDSSGFDAVCDLVTQIMNDGFDSDTLNPVAQEYCREYAQELTERFDNGGDATWQALKKETVDAKKKKGYSAAEKILYATGHLEASLGVDADGNLKNIRADSIDFGTSVPYAKYHDDGEGHLPKREIIVEPSTDLMEKIGEQLDETLCEATK